uniref:Uncharacterized protein n=1 Tax=Sinocyclocheilus anshuiensis TaxID=1608454 RepID=A0A671S4G3_9TELE
ACYYYPNDFYESGQQLFCKFWQHTINGTRKNTCDDHLKSKAHITIASTATSSDARREFVEDFVAVCAESYILLEKMKLLLFLVKHCKQGGISKGCRNSNAVHLLPSQLS